MSMQENQFNFTMPKELNMYYCGRRIKTMNHTYGPEISTHFLIVYIKEGTGTLFHKNGNIRLCPHHLLIMFPNERIHYKVDEDSPWTISWIGVYGNLVNDFFKMLNIDAEYPVYPVENPEMIERILNDIFLYSYDHSLSGKIHCISLIYDFFAALLKNKKLKDDYVKEAIHIIKYNFDKDISVNSIAQTLHITGCHLSRIFKMETGLSPKEFIINERIKNACDLLKNSHASIKEIALSVGIPDPLYFSRLFKRKMGMSPKEFREK